jgi:hypothetical protein
MRSRTNPNNAATATKSKRKDIQQYKTELANE